MATERCPAIKDGQQCVLQVGHAEQHQLAADPGWAIPASAPVAVAGSPAQPAAPKKGVGRGRMLGLGLGGIFIIAYAVNLANKGGSGGAPAAQPPAAGKHLTGTFLSWTAVDDAHGYAYFSVTNSGSVTETAECTIDVRDDFGDFGFDSLVGESVGPGATVSGKMALNVGKGAFLINKGSVKDC